MRSVLRILLCCLLVAEIAHAQIPDGNLFRRVSRASNFEFAIHNNGMLIGDWSNDRPGSRWLYAEPFAHWPRGSFHISTWDIAKGLVVLVKKADRLLVSAGGFMREATLAQGPFDQMVPGRIGDPRGGYDPVFNGAGWRYVDDPDYIVYSSLDYDSTGVDISGANFNDWPIRLVNGSRKYVPHPLERSLYPPVYLSDEDFFCVYKDTDTRADPIYSGPDGPSIPIGIEIHNSVYSWASGPLHDIVVVQYDVINKSGELLDSCYVVWGSGIRLGGRTNPFGFSTLSRKVKRYRQELMRKLTYEIPADSTEWPLLWNATPIPPTIGFPLLETPIGYDGLPVPLVHGVPFDTIGFYVDSAGQSANIVLAPSDEIVYRTFVTPPPRGFPSPVPPCCGPLLSSAPVVLVAGPFQMSVDETIRTTTAYIFSDSLEHLLLLDDLINRVYNSGFQRPSPPPAPKLIAIGLNRAVKLTWDNSAESAVDIIVPDSLGEPFVGYRLLRSQTEEGPYVEIGRWTTDSVVVYEYLDRGEDLPDGQAGIGGLKNNVRYY